MSDKKVTIHVNGQDAVCNFGINYFYKHFKEITGIDLLVEGLKGFSSTELFDLVGRLYYAGYKAECSKNKSDAVLTEQDFTDMVLSGDEALASKLVNDYVNTLPKGEPEAQTTTSL